MEYKDGQFISAYTEKDTLFEGYVFSKKDGTKVVLNEDRKWLPIDRLKYVKIIENNEEDQVKTLVDNDVENYQGLKDIKNDNELEKAADKREGELISSGADIEKGEYTDALTSAVKAQQLGDELKAGNISQSDALQKYQQSKKQDIEMRIKKSLKESNLDDDLDPSYFDVGDYEGPDVEDPAYWDDAVEYDPTEYDVSDEANDEQFDNWYDLYNKEVRNGDPTFGTDRDHIGADIYNFAKASGAKIGKWAKDVPQFAEPIHYDDEDDTKPIAFLDEISCSKDINGNDLYESVSADIEKCIDLYEESCTRYSERDMYKFIAETLGYSSYRETLKECNFSVPDAVLKMAEDITNFKINESMNE